MTDILGNWPVTGYIPLINDPIVTNDFFSVTEAVDPDKATVSFFDSTQNPPVQVSFDASLGDGGTSLGGETTVGAYRYLVTAMIEVVGSPSILFRTISGAVLRQGGGTEDSGGQWNGGPLRPK